MDRDSLGLTFTTTQAKSIQAKQAAAMKAGVEAEMDAAMFNGVVPNRLLAAIHGQGPEASVGQLCLANQQTPPVSASTQGVVAQVGEASTVGKKKPDPLAPTDASFRMQVERVLSEETSHLVNWYQFDESNPVFEGKAPKDILASLEREMQQVCPPIIIDDATRCDLLMFVCCSSRHCIHAMYNQLVSG